MKKIVLSAFVLAGLNSFAQDTEANIQKIADAMSANCGGPKYGEDSVRTITNYSLYREFKKTRRKQSR
ncbi:MAG: hypothetical protein LRY27_03920 [Chitinophagales bacterium]|nr:hypothetical protein [Chitinophagales bacterium]